MRYSEIIKPSLLVSFIVAILLSCSDPSAQKTSDNSRLAGDFSADSVTLIYLHQKKGCKTCRAVSEAVKRAAIRFKGSGVAFVETDINSAKGEVLAEHFRVSFAGLLVYHQTGEQNNYTNITNEAFQFATTNADSLDRIIERTVSSHLEMKKE